MSKLKIIYEGQFKRDYKLAVKRGLNPDFIKLVEKPPLSTEVDISPSQGRLAAPNLGEVLNEVKRRGFAHSFVNRYSY